MSNARAAILILILILLAVPKAARFTVAPGLRRRAAAPGQLASPSAGSTKPLRTAPGLPASARRTAAPLPRPRRPRPVVRGSRGHGAGGCRRTVLRPGRGYLGR